MSWALVGGAVGGIGLFLLGMRLMTEGLKIAAGPMLRDVLGRGTRTRLRGLQSGILITGIVQSSSAVTVAAIGFVNAGIMSLGQALWVIFGSNVGTTMTGWIVAVVGFDIKIEAFALPLLGVGMFLTLTGTTTRRGALGEALAGFGLFFLGIATLKATFAGLGQSIDVAAFDSGGILSSALFVLIGFVLTALVQSSSAVIAIALTAATGGLVGIEAGAALVIGANVGTTTTAVLAVIGATANARRVAVGHVAFNVLTGVVALLLLPFMLVLVTAVERSLALVPEPATTLALFHTVFNVLGVAIMWPLASSLEQWLAARFVSAEEDESRPQYLDRNSLEVPALAVNSVLLELVRVADISLQIARAGFTDPLASQQRLSWRVDVVQRLSTATIDYIQKLHAAKTSSAVAEALSHPIRALWHFGEIAEHGLSFAQRQGDLQELPTRCRKAIGDHADRVAALIDSVQSWFADTSAPPPAVEPIEQRYQLVKAEMLRAASEGGMSATQTETALEALAELHEATRKLERACRRIAAIAAVVQLADAPQEAA